MRGRWISGSSINWSLTVVTLAVVVVSVQLALSMPAISGEQQDFCVYYTGVELAWNRTSPYDIPRVEGKVAERLGIPLGEFPCGFFPPPLSFIALAPWMLLPWPAAKAAWLFASLLAAGACGLLASLFGREAHRGVGWGVIVGLVLLNPLVQRSISLGQTGLFMCACVVVGQRAFERGRPVAGCLLWGLAGVKPHVSLPLIAAAGFTGGWRRAAGIVLASGGMWIMGALLLGDPLTVTVGYFEYLKDSHAALGFNRISNDQFVSWNRLVAAAGGPEFELGSVGAATGLALSLGVIWVLRMRKQPPPPASWTLAACVTWGLFTVQAHGYELVILVLVVPYLLRLYDGRDFLGLTILLLPLLVMSIPRGAVARLGEAVGPSSLLPLLLSYRAVALAFLAVVLIARKPPK